MDYIKIYLNALGMTLEDLRGKLVLDVGAGYCNFAKECHKYKIAKVISIDVDQTMFLANLRYMGSVARPIFREIAGIIASSAALPFQDESFNLVVAHFSVPIFAKTKSEIFSTLDEMLRVLAQDGEARIVPYYISDDHDASLWTKEKLRLLELKRNCQIYKGTSKTTEAAFPGRIKLNRYCVIRKN